MAVWCPRVGERVMASDCDCDCVCAVWQYGSKVSLGGGVTVTVYVQYGVLHVRHVKTKSAQ